MFPTSFRVLHRPALRLAGGLACASFHGACGGKVAASPVVRVAAAASLTAAFDDLGRSFTQATGQQVFFTYGSSGLLAQQLTEGAPFDVFAAADIASVQRVNKSTCDKWTQRVYARGRVVLWSRAETTLAAPKSLQDLVDPRFARIAIANPETAPYGRAAREALVRVGVWSAVMPRLVYAENVRQALQLAETGNAEVALVARSLVYDRVGNVGLLVDEALHAPLDQMLIACDHGSNGRGGRAFVNFVRSEVGQNVLAQHGLDRPLIAPAGER